MTMPPITVLIADHDNARAGSCARLLRPEKGIRLVGRIPSGLDNFASLADLKPDILLISSNVLKAKAISGLAVLRRSTPRTKVILLARRTSDARILDALSFGVRGYLEEDVLGTFLVKAVRCVAGGEAWVPRKMVARIIERLARLTTSK
jgi:DNA-binding NarL/FixJ family response regulator